MDQRVFYGLLERVGGSGRYQTIALCLWSFIMMVMGFTTFNLPFLFYQNDYQCPEGVANCKDYVCSLPDSQRSPFVNQDLFSLASKFGDYRCDNNVEIDRLQSFIYLGGVIGVIIGTFINEIITKKMIMIITVAFNILGLGIAVLGDTILIASIGLFINIAACAIQLQLIQCIIVETVSQQVRGQHMIMSTIFYSLGVTLNGLIFYLLKNCITFIILTIPLLALILLILTYYIEETPFDLVTNFTPEESLVVLEKIALTNGRQHEHKITLSELQNIKREFQMNEEKHEHSNISVLDLFRFDSLRTLTIVSLVLHFFAAFQFIAPQIAIRNYSLSIYTNGVVIGLAEVFGSIVCYFIIDYYARKKVIYITQAICILSSVPVFIFFACSDGKCSHQDQILQTVGLAIFRFAATISYNFFYIQQYQAFPNQIRGLALQFICLPSYFATVIVPQILTFSATTGISIIFSFILCTVVIIIFITCLSQTYGIPPQQMIEELKYEHHQVADPNNQEKIKQT